jgi:hypothetical protein
LGSDETLIPPAPTPTDPSLCAQMELVPISYIYMKHNIYIYIYISGERLDLEGRLGSDETLIPPAPTPTDPSLCAQMELVPISYIYIYIYIYI